MKRFSRKRYLISAINTILVLGTIPGILLFAVFLVTPPRSVEDFVIITLLIGLLCPLVLITTCVTSIVVSQRKLSVWWALAGFITLLIPLAFFGLLAFGGASV
jgi:hypothetical protein